MENIIKDNKTPMNNKRILWVNPSFLDYRIPLYKNLYEKLNGNFHLIFSRRRVPERCIKKTLEAIGDNVFIVEHDKRIIKGGDLSLANKVINVSIPKGLYRLIKKAKPDIIIAEGFFQFTPWAVWYSFIHRKPLLIAYERTAHTERNCPWWRKLYRRFIGLFVNGYIANGQLTKEYLISQGVKPENIFTGGMCADSEGLTKSITEMTKDEKEAMYTSVVGNKHTGITYIFVGQMIPRKGVKELLYAWDKHCKKYTEDKLLLVGNGIQLNEFKENYKDNKSIIFTSDIDYSEIYKYYAISDVFIIPTLEDNWSLVVPEAMACGLPIACSIYNGCHPELVKKDENGITFDPLKQESIIETLAYFHTQNLEKMGQKSIEIEKGYNPENTANNIIKAVTKYLN